MTRHTDLAVTLAATFADLMETCARRQLSLEGIPMYLGLEAPLNTTEAVTFRSDTSGTRLAETAEALFAHTFADTPEPSVRALRLFVETLAQALFTPALGPAPAPRPLPPSLDETEPLLLPKPLTASFAELLTNFRRGAYLRAVNFHNTPREAAAHYDAQLRFYAEHFSSVTEDDLARFFSTGRWHKEKPGVILAFYDATRNQAEVAAHNLDLIPDEYGDGRLALSWDEVCTLGERHVVASHTLTHTALTERSPDVLMAREIGASKRALEARLGRPVKTFAWLRGSEYGLNPRADAYLRASGYSYLFSTFKVQRLGLI